MEIHVTDHLGRIGNIKFSMAGGKYLMLHTKGAVKILPQPAAAPSNHNSHVCSLHITVMNLSGLYLIQRSEIFHRELH